MADPVLDLSTIAPERDTIRIDGEAHDLILYDDLGLVSRRELNRAWQRVLQIEAKEEISPTDETEYEDLMVKMCLLLIPSADRHKIKSIGKQGRESIVLSFFGKQDQVTRTIARLIEENAMRSSVGNSSSQDSNGTMEETPNDGSTSPSDSSDSI